MTMGRCSIADNDASVMIFMRLKLWKEEKPKDVYSYIQVMINFSYWRLELEQVISSNIDPKSD